LLEFLGAHPILHVTRIRVKERKWQWIVHMLRKPNVAIENLALDWNPQGVRRHGCPRNIS
jgi:hypothetical protein